MHARSLAIAIALTLSTAACGKDDAKSDQPAAKPEAKKKHSNVIKFESPVPYGKHVACPDLVDGAKFATYIGDEVGEVKDRSSSNAEATSVCSFMRAGTPPSSNDQLRSAQKNALRLGVLPGDEFCTVTAFCSYPANPEEFKKKCDGEGKRENHDLGQFACVQEFQRASEYAYTYRVIDPETKCIFEVMGGPSVTDESLVQNCTRAALETIGPENIKKFQ
jgi:hypothetical protein